MSDFRGPGSEEADHSKREHYHHLEVWQVAYNLAKQVFKLTSGFPPEERYGLSQQLRRAAVSLVANLAEGHARGSRKEFLQFCTTARGSQAEAHALLMLSRDLGFAEPAAWEVLDLGYTRVGQMLNKLIGALRRPPKK